MCLMFLTHLRVVKVWILDDAEHVAEWVEDGRNLDPAPDIHDVVPQLAAEILKPRQGGRRVGNSPIGDRSLSTRLAVRNQPEFEPAHFKPNVERLVKIRFLAEDLSVPLLAASQVGGGVEHCAKSVDHEYLPCRPRSAPRTYLADDGQVVPMDHLDIRHFSDRPKDLLRGQPADPLGVRRGIVGQSARELDSIPIAQGNDIPLAKRAVDRENADRQQAPPVPLDSLAGAVVKMK